ncbi:N-(5'-phosphoribosyl)anthranilate isomerase [Gymnodinialimonas sp. 57CJ19]|uniref:N-(5'-phosphoribosyl)anthranilate isomerase n=1 Tax=Gymnodinialimonas sp. 57CJ19 TaxID=3138498 RepID=UPI0031344398
MTANTPTGDPSETWIEQTFDCPGVHNGGLFRISVKAVKRGAGMERFKQELDRRKFRALENDGNIVVFCNTLPVAILASGPGRGNPPPGAASVTGG